MVIAVMGASHAVPTHAQTLQPASVTLQPRPQQGVFLNDVLAQSLDDAKRLPSLDTLTWITMGAAIAAASSAIDHPSSSAMSSLDIAEDALGPGETIGGARMQLIGAAATYAFGHVTGHGEARSVGAELLRAQLITQALTAAVKLTVQRGRPDGTQYSFPSGHSAVTFASATVLSRHFGWKVGVPAYAVASYVAASRVSARRHFLSDVAFGAAVGIAVGRTVTIGHGGTRFALTPMASPDGAGMALTWVGQTK
jgi:hypothetical protein